MADSVHISKAQLDALHKPGCLTKCNGDKRKKGDPCAHIANAIEQAEDHDTTYNYPTYIELCSETNDFFMPSTSPKARLQKCPRAGEWDIGVGNNFQHYKVPYWHNSHHIVPNGSLKSSIAEAGKGDRRLPNLIKYALLKAEYNLNFKDNMVILPMESVVAQALALPRHLKGDEVRTGEKTEIFSHPDYSKYVTEGLVPILNGYKKTLADALKKEHLALPGSLARSELEQLSMTLYIEIIHYGSIAKKVGSLADVVKGK